MLFHSIEFVVFIIVLFIILLLQKRNFDKKVTMLVFSCIFYMWWNPVFILLILGSIVIDFTLGKKIFKTSNVILKKRYLLISVLANLGMLGFFKYFNLFSDSFLWLFREMGYQPSWISLNIILPVGISFFTFQTMSYTIDIYKGNLKPTDSFLDFAVFVSFFPQLVAGPIIRARDFLPELKGKIKFDFDNEHFLLILKGLVKKAIFADNIGFFVDSIYSNPELYPSSIIILATIGFSFQIYLDFSGYTDMAIGIAAVLGFKFPKNFDRPYFAITPSQFWRKWHISLSSWLRDYLYIPLGGNRGGNFFIYRNLMITMLLGGLWHGASWNFVIWGFLHGLILVVYKASKLDRLVMKNKMLSIMSWLFMQWYILLTWISFRQVDFDKMLITMKKFVLFDFNFSLQNIGLGKLSFFSTLLFILVFMIYHTFSFVFGGVETRWGNYSKLRQSLLFLFVGFILFYFWPLKESPFIYFQF